MHKYKHTRVQISNFTAVLKVHASTKHKTVICIILLQKTCDFFYYKV